MTKVDFHILPSTQDDDVYRYVARLAQKALGRRHRVLIAVEDSHNEKVVSDSLWGLQPEAFLAHNTIDDNDHSLQITSNGQCGEHHDVLINLCTSIPEYFSRFERVFEVVSQHPEKLTLSRNRYRYYQDNGYAIERHDLRDRA